MGDARRAKTPLVLPAPQDLRVRFVRRAGEELAILSFAWRDPELPAALTDAEREVALCALRGWSNARIAKSRGRSLRTIANQLASVFRKASVGSRGELIARYAR